METLKKMGLKWKNPITIEDIHLFVAEAVDKRVTQKTINYYIEYVEKPLFEIEKIELFEQFLENGAFSKVPKNIRKRMLLKPRMYTHNLQVIYDNDEESVGVFLKEITGMETYQEDLGELIEGYALKRVFHQETTEIEARSILLGLIYDIKVSIEKKEDEGDVGSVIMNEISEGLRKELKE